MKMSKNVVLICPFCKKECSVYIGKAHKWKTCYDCRGMALRKSSADITWKQLWQIIAGRKASKEKGFDLTLEQFIEISSRNCYYCDAKPTPSKGHRKWATYVDCNGLDRVDNERGYLYDNVVACCKYCNAAKRERTTKEFFEWIAQVAKHNQIM